MGRHAKPKEEAETRDWLGWINFLRKDDDPEVPRAEPYRPVTIPIQAQPVVQPCVICDTYEERGLAVPAGHECLPVTLADKPVVRLVSVPASARQG